MKKWIFTTHLATNIVIQSHLLGPMIINYNLDADYYVYSTLLCLALLLADYSIASFLLRKSNIRLENKFHFQDLVCAIPGVLLDVLVIFYYINRGITGRESIVAIAVANTIHFWAINTLLVIERFILTRKSNL